MQHVVPLGLLPQNKHEDVNSSSNHNQSQAANTSSSSPQVQAAPAVLPDLSMSQNANTDPYGFMAEEMSILSPAGHPAPVDMPASNAPNYASVPAAQGSASCRAIAVAQKSSDIYSNMTHNSEPIVDSHNTEIRRGGESSSQDSNKSINFDLQQARPGSGSLPKRRGRKKKLIEADNMQIGAAQQWLVKNLIDIDVENARQYVWATRIRQILCQSYNIQEHCEAELLNFVNITVTGIKSVSLSKPDSGSDSKLL